MANSTTVHLCMSAVCMEATQQTIRMFCLYFLYRFDIREDEMMRKNKGGVRISARVKRDKAKSILAYIKNEDSGIHISDVIEIALIHLYDKNTIAALSNATTCTFIPNEKHKKKILNGEDIEDILFSIGVDKEGNPLPA